MTSVPLATPVTVPDKEPTVAIPEDVALQVPPVEASDKVIDEPGQMGAEPAMGPGAPVTTNVFVVTQPVESV